MAAPACPFLGLKDDPETTLEFPADANFCHHARPIGPVRGDYQRSVCLTDSYAQCPVYLRHTLGPLPAHVLAPRQGLPPVILWVGALAAFLVMFAVLLAFGGLDSVLGNLGWGSDRPEARQVLVTANPSQTPFQPSMAASAGPEESLAVVLPPTDTPEPTAVVCVPPGGWVVYDVKPTDSLLRLSLVYGLEVSDLQQANCLGERTIIRPGDQLYVPVLPTVTPSITPSATVRIIYFTAAPLQPTDPPVQPRPQPTAAQPTAAPPTQAPPPTAIPPTQAPPPTAVRPTQPLPTDAP